MHPTRVLLVCAAASVVCAANAFSQSADPLLWVPNGEVRAIARNGNTLYVGGSFTRVSPNIGSGAELDLTTGKVRLPFAKIGGIVRDAEPDGAGGWYIGGTFTSINDVTRNHLAHILADGTLSPWNPDVNQVVYEITVSGSIVYVGGSFVTIGGQSRTNIAALDRDTGVPTSWNPSGAGVTNGNVSTILVDGNTVYVSGTFTRIGGQNRRYIASLDAITGSVNAWDPNPSQYATPYAVVGSTLYVGGLFTTIAGEPRNRVAAFDTSTGALTSWDPNSNGTLYCMTISGSTAYIGGDFTSIGGQTRSLLAQIDLATGAPTSWNPNVTGTDYPDVQSIVAAGSTVYIEGDFTAVGGQLRIQIAAVDAASGAPTAWTPSATSVSCLGWGAGKLFVGGSGLGGVTRNNLAAIDLTTGEATAWNPNVDGGPFPYGVSALAISGSLVYAGGHFDTVGGSTRHRIAAMSTGTAVATAWNPNADGPVLALAVSGNTIYAGGSFANIGGSGRASLGALDATTGLATGWNPSTNGTTYALSVNGSVVYAGGAFSTAGGASRSNLAAIDVTSGSATAWAPNPNAIVRAMARMGTTLYIGGGFTVVDGQAHNRIAGIDTASGAVLGWNADVNDDVYAVAVDQAVYAGGEFTSVSGQTRNRVVALDFLSADVVGWDPNATAHNPCVVQAINVGSRAYVGGTFTSIGGSGSQANLASLTRYQSTSAVPSIFASGSTLHAMPNPATEQTALRFSLASASSVRLGLFDPSGRRVVELLHGESMSAGTHHLLVPTAGLPAGTYFLRLESSLGTESRKLLVVR